MTNLSKDELIRRYVYDVVRRLPQQGRADIEEELKSSIYDTLAARAGDGGYTEADVEAVLEELGSPAKLAANYRGEKRALISGEYYDKYLFVLKLVMTCVAVGMAIGLTIDLIADPPAHFINGVGEVVSSFIMAMIQAFAWVTVIFIFVERLNVKLDLGDMEAWKPETLPPVPEEQAVIKKGDPIAGIVFTVIVMLLFNFVPYFFGVYIFTDPVQSVSIFNIDVLRMALPFINAALLLGILREVLRVVAGCYTLRLAIAIVILNIIALGLILPVLLNPALWNHQFMAQLDAVFHFGFNADLMNILSYLPLFFVAIFLFAYVLDSATALYKGIRYGR